MKIDYIAGDRKRLIIANEGAVATMSINGSDPVAGLVTRHTSSDGYRVSAFTIQSEGQNLPLTVMVNDNPVLKFEIISKALVWFYASENRAAMFNYFREVCAHYDWQFETYAAINGAYWLAMNFKEINDETMVAAAEIVKASRTQFYGLVKAIRIEEKS